MSLDHWVAIISAAISFSGLLLVAIQIRESTKQRELESLVEILDVNRQLITLGFSHPKLFAILRDGEDADPAQEQYYLQLWLNQFSLVHSYLKHSMLRGEQKENLERDMREFMTMKNMRKHWQRFGTLYPASFQSYVNEILKTVEPPTAAAHVKSGR